jgi:hypothetical protein
MGIVFSFLGFGLLLVALSGMPIGRCSRGDLACQEAALNSPMRPFVAVTGAIFALPGVVLLVLGRRRR